MTNYRAPVSDMQFLLRKVFKTEEVFLAMPGTKEVTNGLCLLYTSDAADE